MLQAWTAVLTLAALGWLNVLYAVFRMRWRPTLAEVPAEAPPGSGWPRVSVIVPSRDEEEGVEAATRSLLAQDYPDLEVVAIDDRSTDRTGEILDRLAATDPRLRVVHVRELPTGWLGKNNAMRTGAAQASGAWFLFTDGDIVFEKEAVRRAIAYSVANGLGHLVAVPRFLAPGFLERSFVSTFAAGLLARLRTWTLNKPRTLSYVGAGAFNLIRRSDYERVGGHEKVRMEVVDDVKLGLILRRSGVPQGAIDSGGLVRVRWQSGFINSLRGLVKNAFPGMDYNWGFTAIVISLMLIAGFAGPIALALGPDERFRIAGGAVTAVALLANGLAARQWAAGSGVEAIGFPINFLGMAWITLWSAVVATRRGGIAWRGTVYPLADLRKGNVRELDWPAAAAVGWPERGGPAAP